MGEGRSADGDVVGSGVGSGVAGPQDRREWRACPGGAVVGERQDRMESEATRVIRCREFLLRVGGNQGRIKINDEVIADLGRVKLFV